MKAILKPVFFILSLVFLMAVSRKFNNTIEYSDINGRVKVIGKLKQPLGQVVRVEGLIIDGSGSRIKGHEGKFFLDVRLIDGEKIENKLIIELQFFSWVNIKKPLNSKYKKYIGYETGTMAGIPENAFRYIPRVASKGFHFKTYFNVCKELN